ncbi:MAG: hypothetical protein PVF40_07715 [Ectothiorhodospiraceae bacterium]|jgi:hypothetical protein
MKHTIKIALLALLSSSVGLAAQSSELQEGRKATAKYADLQVALNEGFQVLFECTSHADRGAMGVHYVHPGRMDGKLTLTEPEVLMYEPQADGTMQLVGVEHIVPESAWHSAEPPRFLGRALQRKTAVGVHPVDPFYEIHVWHWRRNPQGIFADWNPEVSC